MLTLNGRVGDLEGVERAHVDVARQVWQGAGHAQEADLALALQVQQRLHGAVLFQLRHRRAAVELHEVEVVRVHAAQALLHAVDDILAGEDVGEPPAG